MQEAARLRNWKAILLAAAVFAAIGVLQINRHPGWAMALFAVFVYAQAVYRIHYGYLARALPNIQRVDVIVSGLCLGAIVISGLLLDTTLAPFGFAGFGVTATIGTLFFLLRWSTMRAGSTEPVFARTGHGRSDK